MNRARLITVLIAGALPLSTLASEAQYEFVAKDSSIATKTCISAASNDVSSLKKYARQGFDGNFQLMGLSLTCNGVDVNSFAQSFGATDTNDFLNGRVSRKYQVDNNVDIIDISGAYPPLTGNVQVVVSGK